MPHVHGFSYLVRSLGLRHQTPRELREELDQQLLAAPDAATARIVSMLERTAIWLPVSTHQRLPVLLPHVARDNSCRKRVCNMGHMKRGGHAPRDMWSTPSRDGYVSDDNSLVKALTKNLGIRSDDRAIDGWKMGDDWVACHIWAMSDAEDEWLNSFVPNLVWLPKPLDVLSDRPGHPVQALLRGTSLRRYRRAQGRAEDLVEALFGQLDRPGGRQTLEVRNEFQVPERWLRQRWRKVSQVAALLQAVAQGQRPGTRSGHSHYDRHVGELAPHAVAPLAERLSRYARSTSP